MLGVVTPDAQELVRDAAILFDIAVDPREREPLPRLAGRPLPRRRGGRVLDVDRRRQHLVGAGPDQQDAGQRGNPLRQQAFVPSIEVGPGGELVVTYYDFRNDRGPGEAS